MHLTPEQLAAAYELLRTTPPFNRWKLPDSDDVIFNVTNSKTVEGKYQAWKGAPDRAISVSTQIVRTLDELVQTMAHEMVHLHQDYTRQIEYSSGGHGPIFRKYAAQVCRHHSWNPLTF